MKSRYIRTCHDDTYTYEHILQAERKLGRKLKPGETVHHIDEDKKNNSIDNLMVFSSNAEHTAFHKSKGNGVLVKSDDGSYCYLANPPLRRCKYCGRSFYRNQISYQSEYCSDICRNAVTNQGKCPTKHELETLVDQFSNCQIAKKFGVSDKAVAKWKKKFNL